MATWVALQPTILDDLVCHDGLHDNGLAPTCAHCLNETGTYRCMECVQLLYCSQCIVERHEHLPLHRVEVCMLDLSGSLSNPSKVWQDGFYQRTSLQELGFCFHLGHQYTPCPSGDPPKKILVIAHNGAHYINVQFCTCEDSPSWLEHYRQLLRNQWYPASYDRPQTAFTFDLLDSFHKLSLQGKLNLYDFYLSTMQKTDNCGRKKTIVRFSVVTIDH